MISLKHNYERPLLSLSGITLPFLPGNFTDLYDVDFSCTLFFDSSFVYNGAVGLKPIIAVYLSVC
jgi:hypothetical protein